MGLTTAGIAASRRRFAGGPDAEPFEPLEPPPPSVSASPVAAAASERDERKRDQERTATAPQLAALLGELLEPPGQPVDVVVPRGVAELDPLAPCERLEARRQIPGAREGRALNGGRNHEQVVGERTLELEPDEVVGVVERRRPSDPSASGQLRPITATTTSHCVTAPSITATKSLPSRIVSTSMNTLAAPNRSASAS